MKALLLSITAGQGHHATAEAIENGFKQIGVESKFIDAYEYIEPRLKRAVSTAYSFNAAYNKRVYSLAYGISVKKTSRVSKYSLPKIMNSLMANELRKCILEEKPDVIVCTHIFPATMINILLERDKLDVLTVAVLTDFTLHPFWEEIGLIDYYVTPSELIEYQIIKKGLDPNKQLPFGIPIKAKFNERMPKAEAKKLLGLDPDKHTILLMSGSMGYGKIDKSIEELDGLPFDFQTIVVCGNNKRQLRKIKSVSKKKRFDVYGYVDNVDVMMDAADCIITKPGGITSSEAISKGLPMIMSNPIPGQEDRNVDFMLNNGLALYASKTFPLDEAVYYLFKNPNRLNEIKTAMEAYRKEYPTERLCQFLKDNFDSKSCEIPETEKKEI